MERSSEEIRDFVLDKVLPTTLRSLRLDVEQGMILNNEQVQFMYEAIGDALKQRVNQLNGLDGVSLIMEIDELSIYTDAFSQYCQGRKIVL